MKTVVSLMLLAFCVGALSFGWNQQQKPSDTDQGNANNAAQQPKPAMPTSDNQTSAQNDKQSTESHSEPPTWWNADRGTWALVIVGVLGTFAALWTLGILKGQLGEMKGAGELMERQLTEIQKQAEATGKTVGLLEKQAGLMEGHLLR